MKFKHITKKIDQEINLKENIINENKFKRRKGFIQKPLQKCYEMGPAWIWITQVVSRYTYFDHC